MHKTNIIILLIISLALFSCADAPNFTDTPEIEFIGFSKTEISQSSGNEEFLTVSFSFNDGDGDIGQGDMSNTTDIIFIDNRTGEIYDQFKSPFVPEQGSNNGLSGRIDIVVFSTCCVFDDGTPPCESPPNTPTNNLSFDITLTDRAGNVSNVVTTPSITLLCD